MLPFLTTAITTGVQLASQPNAKDAERFAQADAWYKAAIQGDPDALCALKFMSGQYGSATCGALGLRAGFATKEAKDYTHKLYEQATRVLAGSVPASSALPPQPGAEGSPVGDTLRTISEVTGAAASGLGKPPAQTLSASATGGQWLLFGAVAVAVVGLVILIARRA